MIIQSGITEVIYLGDKYHDSNMSIASRRMFDMAGIPSIRGSEVILSSILHNW